MHWKMLPKFFLFFLLSECKMSATVSPEKTILVHSAVLDPAGKFQLHWNFDEEKIVFEVQVKTLGYVGFGLSPNGDMTGSDIVIGGVYNANGEVYFTDRHATGKREPVVDESQDWDIVYGSQSDTHTTLRFWRLLDTCDRDDRPVQWETARVLWAYSAEDADSTGTVSYHFENRGAKSIFLLNPQKTVPEIPGDSLIVNFLNIEYEVPDTHTTYWCQAFPIPDMDRKHHVIKFEPVIQVGHESLVHHIVMIGCYPPVTNETAGQGDYCYDGLMPAHWRGCFDVTFAWAIGGGPFYFPEHVGFPFGFDGDPSLILLQTHYDNPGRLKGLVDSSGLRLTLSPRPRQYDAGLLTTGILSLKALMIPPFSKMFRTDGHCVPDCLTQAMENHTEHINMFAGCLHAHLLGTAIRVRHFRDGVEQNIILDDENYDFNFQETRTLNKEVKILPGDHIITECDYKTTHKDQLTFGGESTNEEMCLSFNLYYPRIPLSLCQSTVYPEYIAEFANATLFANLTVREPEEFAGTPYYDFVNDNVNWRDKITRDRFQDVVTTYDNPVRPFCAKDFQNIHKVHWQKVYLPKITSRLPKKEECHRPWPGGATVTTLSSLICLMSAVLSTVSILV